MSKHNLPTFIEHDGRLTTHYRGVGLQDAAALCGASVQGELGGDTDTVHCPICIAIVAHVRKHAKP